MATDLSAQLIERTILGCFNNVDRTLAKSKNSYVPVVKIQFDITPAGTLRLWKTQSKICPSLTRKGMLIHGDNCVSNCIFHFPPIDIDSDRCVTVSTCY
jgi:hypothetical protein